MDCYNVDKETVHAIFLDTFVNRLTNSSNNLNLAFMLSRHKYIFNVYHKNARIFISEGRHYTAHSDSDRMYLHFVLSDQTLQYPSPTSLSILHELLRQVVLISCKRHGLTKIVFTIA